MKKNINRFKFNDILEYQILSEDFIEFNIKRIRTKFLGCDILERYQFLSLNFVKKYSKHLYLFISKEYQDYLHITPYIEVNF